MKVVLVTLSGDPRAAFENIASQYPQCIIEKISRTELESGSFFSRLRALRAHRPDIFAIATEKLEWQRGQDLFMLFGALAGAGEVVLIDAQGNTRRESRGKTFSSAPAQLLRSTTSGAAIVARARRELKQLELEIGQRSEVPTHRWRFAKVKSGRSLPARNTGTRHAVGRSCQSHQGRHASIATTRR